MERRPGKASAAQVEGVVTGLRERAEPLGTGLHTRIDQIITFTLVCPDERPDVIMRADAFTGPLFEGDRVQIPVTPHRRAGATIQTVVLVNLSRGEVFGTRTGRDRPSAVRIVAVACLVAAVVALVVLALA